MFEFSSQLNQKVNDLQKELDYTNQRFEDCLSIADVALWEYDIASNTMYLTKKLSGRFEDNNKVISNYHDSMIAWNIIHPDDIAIFEAYCKSLNSGEFNFVYEYRQITDGIEFSLLRNEGVTVCDNLGIPKRVIGRTIDITKEKNDDNLLLERAYNDCLTGLSNRDKFILDCNEYLKDASMMAALIVVDVDDFKTINDSLGHKYGDYVLKLISTILTVNIKPSDFLGRIGGDEFCILLTGIDSIEVVNTTYNGIKSSLRMISAEKLNISLSFGVALSPINGNSYNDLFTKADIALYMSKRTKDSLTIYNEEQSMPVNDIGARIHNEITPIDFVDKGNDKPSIESMQELNEYFNMFSEIQSFAYYLVNISNYEIKYISDKMRNLLRIDSLIDGNKCYEVLHNSSNPCHNCPLKDSKSFGTKLRIFTSGDRIYNITSHNLSRTDSSLVCLEDITAFYSNLEIDDYLTGVMSYIPFLVNSSKMVQGNKHYEVFLFYLRNLQSLSDRSNLLFANEVIINFASHLISNLDKDDLVGTCGFAAFSALVLNDNTNASAKVRNLIEEFNSKLNKRYHFEFDVVEYQSKPVTSERNNIHDIISELGSILRGV